MESSVSAAPPTVVDSEPSLSIFQRVAAIFARPARAWAGLDRSAQWWFPLLIMMIASGVSGALLHQRALVPMLTEQWEQQVQDGRLPAEQMDRMQQFFASPAGFAVTVGQQILFIPIVTLLVALLIWFGCGFVLGTKLRYRHALEVAAWSSLVNLPGIAITTALAWSKETMRGIHVGFGILLPETDTPGKLQIALGALLDGIGPLALWYLAVAILGAAALSGAKPKSVAWVIGGLYLAMLVFLAAMAAMFTPTAA